MYYNVLQRSTNCSILPSWMGEHGEHGTGTDGKHLPDELRHSNYDSKHSFWQLKTLEKHYIGSAQNWRTSSEM